jgi:hypothetical protein
MLSFVRGNEASSRKGGRVAVCTYGVPKCSDPAQGRRALKCWARSIVRWRRLLKPLYLMAAADRRSVQN